MSLKKIVVIALSLVAATASGAAAQIVISRPALEAGLRAAAIAEPSTSGLGGSPHLTWNITRRTAVEFSTDLQPARDNGFTRLSRHLTFAELKHTIFELQAGRMFLTLGGTAGTERHTTSPSAFIPSNGRVVTMPPSVSRRSIGGFTVGVGYERVLNRHIAFNVQTSLAVTDRVGLRTVAGFSTPLGSYRLRRQTSGPANSRLSNVQPGDKVWVTMADGAMWKGVVTGISLTQIELAQSGLVTPLSIEQIRKIETTDRIGDGIRKGALAGGLSAVPATLALVSTCGGDDECSYYAGLFGVIWAGVGAGVGSVVGALADSLHEGRRTIYEGGGVSVRLSPIVGLHKAGVGGAIRW